MEDEVHEHVVTDFLELRVLEDDLVEPVVGEAVPWNAGLGSVAVGNDPLIMFVLFGCVLAAGETRGSVRALLLEIDARVIGIKAFEPELEAKVLVEVSDVDVFKTLVVESSGGDVLF